MDLMADLLRLGKQIVASQPFSLLLGADLIDYAAGRAELGVPISDRFKGDDGLVHSGLVAYAAENALALAGSTTLGASVASAEFKINYVLRAEGDALIARASVIHTGKVQAVCRCEVFLVGPQGERLCASAQGTVVRRGAD
jgi:uncharacterized protein (TIGR00369 family)